MKTQFKNTLFSALVLAFVSTFGDFLWAALDLPHKALYGVVHGAVMCLAIGMVLGQVAKSGWRKSLLAGLICLVGGAIISGLFYPLYGLMGASAMFVCWMLLWISFALIYRHLNSHRETINRTMIRGCIAALGSAAGFYPIYILWTKPVVGAYHLFLLAWTIAFLPGFAGLFLKKGMD